MVLVSCLPPGGARLGPPCLLCTRCFVKRASPTIMPSPPKTELLKWWVGGGCGVGEPGLFMHVPFCVPQSLRSLKKIIV